MVHLRARKATPRARHTPFDDGCDSRQTAAFDTGRKPHCKLGRRVHTLGTGASQHSKMRHDTIRRRGTRLERSAAATRYVTDELAREVGLDDDGFGVRLVARERLLDL